MLFPCPEALAAGAGYGPRLLTASYEVGLFGGTDLVSLSNLAGPSADEDKEGGDQAQHGANHGQKGIDAGVHAVRQRRIGATEARGTGHRARGGGYGGRNGQQLANAGFHR